MWLKKIKPSILHFLFAMLLLLSPQAVLAQAQLTTINQGSIAVGESRAGILAPGEQHSYQLPVSEAVFGTITVESNAISAPSVTLFDPSGQLIALGQLTSQPGSLPAVASAALNGSEAGTYTIYVSDYFNLGGEYTIAVTLPTVANMEDISLSGIHSGATARTDHISCTNSDTYFVLTVNPAQVSQSVIYDQSLTIEAYGDATIAQVVPLRGSELATEVGGTLVQELVIRVGETAIGSGLGVAGPVISILNAVQDEFERQRQTGVRAFSVDYVGSQDLRFLVWGTHSASGGLRVKLTWGDQSDESAIPFVPPGLEGETIFEIEPCHKIETVETSPIQANVPRVYNNADWTPVIREFDGVEMVLIPPGCFMMGRGDFDLFDQRPVHQQCFGEPFWIDLTEVTQADFERLGGVKRFENEFEGDQRPVENIKWFEARDFCALRGARLPTEREWEYAARGPDSLAFPWGNEWNEDNTVWLGNSNDQTANVGSRTSDTSWVGALDMMGNVQEFTASLHAPYPYSTDGRLERDTGSNTNVYRVIRGESWRNTVDRSVTDRSRIQPNLHWFAIGFRCARSYETTRPQPTQPATATYSSAVQLGQLVTATSVDRDGCPGEVTTRFAPSDSIYVVARETDVAQGTAVFIRLYHEGQSVEDTDEIVADSDMRVCINFVFENSQGFDTGNYEAEFFVNGLPAGTIAFTVR